MLSCVEESQAMARWGEGHKDHWASVTGLLLNLCMKPVREIIKKFKLKNHHYTGGPRLTTIRSETIRSYDGAVKITLHPIYDHV